MTRTDIASRVVAAPVDRVFNALVTPAELLAWLPPAGMSATFDHVDLRAGGSYRMVLTYAVTPEGGGKASADSDVVEARILELVPDDRLVQAVDFESDDPAFAGTMTMTWSVRPTDGGTRVEFRADDVPSGISAEDHADGLASSLANLAAHVEPRATPTAT